MLVNRALSELIDPVGANIEYNINAEAILAGQAAGKGCRRVKWCRTGSSGRLFVQPEMNQLTKMISTKEIRDFLIDHLSMFAFTIA